MSVLGESNILDLSFKAFSSQEDSSSKKFSYDDYENITNQFSNVLIQQVNYEPKEKSYFSNDYGYEEESFVDNQVQEDVIEESKKEYDTINNKAHNKYTDKREDLDKKPESDNTKINIKTVVTRDIVNPISEHMNFRDRVEQLASSTKDISQVLGDKQFSNEGIIKQKSGLKHLFEQMDVQTNVFKGRVVDKSQLQSDLASRLSELQGKTKSQTSQLLKQTKQEQLDGKSIKEEVFRKNELLKTPSEEMDEFLFDLNIEDIKVSKSTTSKSLKGQLNELAAKASIKESNISDNSEHSFMNQQQESHDGMNSSLHSLNNLLSNNNSTVKMGNINNTEFNKLLNFMEQQHSSDIDVLNQVINNMKHNISINGRNSISMILNPHSLGRLNIDLVSHNGILSAEIKAENEQTKELLTRNIDSLKQSLQEQGVTVGNVIVKSQESSLSNNNFTKDFSQGNMKDFDSNNKTGSQKQNFEQNSQTNYEHDLQQEEHQNKKSIKTINSLHNGLVDYTI